MKAGLYGSRTRVASVRDVCCRSIVEKERTVGEKSTTVGDLVVASVHGASMVCPHPGPGLCAPETVCASESLRVEMCLSFRVLARCAQICSLSLLVHAVTTTAHDIVHEAGRGRGICVLCAYRSITDVPYDPAGFVVMRASGYEAMRNELIAHKLVLAQHVCCPSCAAIHARTTARAPSRGPQNTKRRAGKGER